MSSTREVLLMTVLALHRVTLTLTGFPQPLDTGNWSQVNVHLHRGERSLERMEYGVIKERIKDFLNMHMFPCIFNWEINEICFPRITVAVMAYIHGSFEYEYDTDEE